MPDLRVSRAFVHGAFRKRWEVLSVMTGAGPMSIRVPACRLDRDMKAVNGGVHAL
jgi:hypothetical protein